MREISDKMPEKASKLVAVACDGDCMGIVWELYGDDSFAYLFGMCVVLVLAACKALAQFYNLTSSFGDQCKHYICTK